MNNLSSTQKELEKIIQQQSLIETNKSLDGLSDIVLPTSLYFGIGLCNGGAQTQLSQGVPIDILSMVLVGEILAEKKYILIADEHAKTNGFSENEVLDLASRYRETINKAIQNMGLCGWEVVLASEITLLEIIFERILRTDSPFPSTRFVPQKLQYRALGALRRELAVGEDP